MDDEAYELTADDFMKWAEEIKNAPYKPWTLEVDRKNYEIVMRAMFGPDWEKKL